MRIILLDAYNELIYFFYHEQGTNNRIVRVGRSSIFPFGSDAELTKSGNVYYRILSRYQPTADLQYIISNTFDIPNFKSRQAVLITIDEIPERLSSDPSIVSHQT